MPDALLPGLITGALLGLTGQGVRAALGLQDMRAKGEPFDQGRLWLSLVYGTIAGILAAILAREATGLPDDPQALLALVAAGYAGADFVESVMRRQVLPGAPT